MILQINVKFNWFFLNANFNIIVDLLAVAKTHSEENGDDIRYHTVPEQVG